MMLSRDAEAMGRLAALLSALGEIAFPHLSAEVTPDVR